MGKFCTNCGKPCNEGAKFCSGCGAPIISNNQPQPLNNKAAYQGQDKVNNPGANNAVNHRRDKNTTDPSSKVNKKINTETVTDKPVSAESNIDVENKPHQEIQAPDNDIKTEKQDTQNNNHQCQEGQGEANNQQQNYSGRQNLNNQQQNQYGQVNLNKAQYSQQYGNQRQYQNNPQYYGGQQYSGGNSQQNPGRQYNNQEYYNQGYGNGQYQYNMNGGYGIQNPSALSNVMMNLLNIIIKPAKGIQEFMDNRTKEETYATLGIGSGIQCLLFMWLMRRLLFTTFTLGGILSGEYEDIYDSFSGYVTDIINKAISSLTGTFFITGVFITAVLVFGYILSLHILNKNADTLIKVKIVTIAVIQIACGMFVIILLSYLFVPLSYCITGFVSIAVIAYFVGNTQKYITNGECKGYALALIYMIIGVIAAIISIIVFLTGAFTSVISLSRSIF